MPGSSGNGGAAEVTRATRTSSALLRTGSATTRPTRVAGVLGVGVGVGLPDVDGVVVALAEGLGVLGPGADGTSEGDAELLVDDEDLAAAGELAPGTPAAAGSTAAPGRDDAAAAGAVEAPGLGMLEWGLPLACGGGCAASWCCAW